MHLSQESAGLGRQWKGALLSVGCALGCDVANTPHTTGDPLSHLSSKPEAQ